MSIKKSIWFSLFLFICPFLGLNSDVAAATVSIDKALNSTRLLIEKPSDAEINIASFHKKISRGVKKVGKSVSKGAKKAGKSVSKGVSKGANKVGKTIKKGTKTISRGAKIGAGAVVGAGVAAGAAVAAGANAIVDAAKEFRFSQAKPFAKSGKCKAGRPGKLNASYCNYAEVNMKACAKVFGKKACVGPGKFKTTVAGTTGIVTYLNQKDGKIGATLDARQTVTMNFFGKPIKVGLSCQLTKGAKSSWSKTFGVNFQTPAFPPITTTDVLEAIVTRGAKAAAKTAAKSAAMKSGAKNMNQAMAGYAGAASAGEMMKLIKSSGCNLIIPEAKIFGGIKSFNLARAGARITVAVKNWKIRGKTASADFIVSSGVEAAVGGTKQKIVGKTVKMPGYSWGKDFANLVKFNVSTGGKGKDLSRAISDNKNRKAPRLAYNPGKPRVSRASSSKKVPWQKLPGKLRDIGVGANGVVWGVNKSQKIYRWTGRNWQQMPGAAVRVDVGPRGNAWVVNRSDDIYQWTGKKWRKMPGKLKDIGVGANGVVWGVNKSQKIYRWTGKNWQQMPGAAVRVDVGPRGNAWVVNRSDDIYQWTGKKWRKIAGKLKDIGVGPRGSVWGVNKNQNIYRRDGNKWTQVNGRLRSISVGPGGIPYGTNSNDDIYRGGSSRGIKPPKLPKPPKIRMPKVGPLAALMNKPVCIRAAKGQYVVVENNQKVVNANRRRCGSWETFIIRKDSIYNTAWKTYLSCQPNGRLEGNRKRVGSWEKIKVIPQKGGTFAFRCMAHGKKYLVAEGAGGKNMNANRPKVGSWERFRIEPKKGGQARKPRPPRAVAGNLRALMNKPVCIRAAKGQYVVVENNQKVVNANRRKCGSWETFIIRGTLKSAAIYNTAWKTYLSCQPNGRLEGNRKSIGSWEKIKVIPQKGGTFAFRCMAHGKKYLVAEGAGGKNMNANRPKVGSWERFRIEPKRR